MEQDEIFLALRDRKTLDELRSELDVGGKDLKRKLKSLRNSGLIETDGKYYWRADEKKTSKINYLAVLLVIGCIFLGFYLRSYHMDYPVVGYHNWKEVHYLTEARNFAREGFFKYGFFVPYRDYPPLHDDPSGVHGDTFPTVSILAAISFMLFGFELWAARLVGIILSTAVILLIYLIVRKIFEREDIAVVSAFITAITPLFVFFSHNVQLMNVGIFCIMMALYLFLIWRDSNKAKHLILASVFLALGGLTKYPFLVIAAPMLFVFPFERLRELRKNLGAYAVSALILLSLPLWMYYSSVIIPSMYEKVGTLSEGSIKPETLMSSRFWEANKAYISDNFTIPGAYIAVLGLVLFIFSLVTSRNLDLKNRFLLGYLVGFIVFMIIMAAKLQGHSYHYFGIAPVFIIFQAYFITSVGDFIKRLRIEGKQVKYLNLIAIALILAFLFPMTQESAARQFSTQFYGLDVAGGYIKEHKEPGDWIMHSSHQAYGVLWHGDVKGTRGIPSTLEDIKFAEEERNATWIFIYNWDFNVLQDEERWTYISENYRLVQFAFLQSSGGSQPTYMLLRKGGSFDESRINELLAGKPVLHRDYELTNGIVRLNYIDLE